MLIVGGKILMRDAKIAITEDCCCGTPCINCISFIDFACDMESGVADIYMSAASLTPDPVCTGESGTIEFSIFNDTGDAWPADCVDPADPDCAVEFRWFGAVGNVTITGSTPAYSSLVNDGPDIKVFWNSQAFAIGETKTYSITFDLISCHEPGNVIDVAYGRGHTCSIAFECEECPCSPAYNYEFEPVVQSPSEISFNHLRNLTYVNNPTETGEYVTMTFDIRHLDPSGFSLAGTKQVRVTFSQNFCEIIDASPSYTFTQSGDLCLATTTPAVVTFDSQSFTHGQWRSYSVTFRVGNSPFPGITIEHSMTTSFISYTFQVTGSTPITAT